MAKAKIERVPIRTLLTEQIALDVVLRTPAPTSEVPAKAEIKE